MNKKISWPKRLLYSLWMLPVWIATIWFGFALLVMLGSGNPESIVQCGVMFGWLIPFGYLFAPITSRQKRDWVAFFITAAVYAVLVGICNWIGVNDRSSAGMIGAILFLVYLLATIIYGMMQRIRIIVAADYVHSAEYKEKKARLDYAREWKKIEQVDVSAVTDAENARKKRFEDALKSDEKSSDPSPSETAPPEAPVKPKAENAVPVEPENPVLDLNTCDIDALLMLPGMSLADAQRLISERNKNGAYASLEDYIRRNEVKPHIAARFLHLLTVSNAPQPPASPTRKSRTLDL